MTRRAFVAVAVAVAVAVVVLPRDRSLASADSDSGPQRTFYGWGVATSTDDERTPLAFAVQADDRLLADCCGPPNRRPRKGHVEICTPMNCVMTALFAADPDPFPLLDLHCSVVIDAAPAGRGHPTGTRTWYGASHAPVSGGSGEEGPGWYLFRVQDLGTGALDRLGLTYALREVNVDDGRCGAASVRTEPVIAGDFFASDATD